MHTALNGGNTVRIAVDTFVVAGVPLESDIEVLALSIVIFVVAHFCEQWVFRLVEMLHEVDDSALVLEGDFLFALRSLINKRNLEPTIKKCHDLQTIKHRAGNKFCSFCLEYRRVWPKRHRRT